MMDISIAIYGVSSHGDNLYTYLATMAANESMIGDWNITTSLRCVYCSNKYDSLISGYTGIANIGG